MNAVNLSTWSAGSLNLGITHFLQVSIMLSAEVCMYLCATKETLLLQLCPQTHLYSMKISTISPLTPGKFSRSLLCVQTP